MEREYLVVHFMDSITPRGLCQNEEKESTSTKQSEGCQNQKKGWTLPGHNYTGPYNPLEQQLRYDPTTGEILEFLVKPTGKTDAVAAQHDVDYSLCGNDRKCKNKADKKMVAALDAIPWKERQWGHALARNTINVKQKLGLGSGKNGKRF